MMLNACFPWPFWSTVDKFNPRITESLYFITKTGTIRLNTRPGCSHMRCFHGLVFWVESKTSISHLCPAWEKVGVTKETSQPCITEHGKTEKRIGFDHTPLLSRRGQRERSGKDQDSDKSLQPQQSGLQSSSGSRITHPLNGKVCILMA